MAFQPCGLYACVDLSLEIFLLNYYKFISILYFVILQYKLSFNLSGFCEDCQLCREVWTPVQCCTGRDSCWVTWASWSNISSPLLVIAKRSGLAHVICMALPHHKFMSFTRHKNFIWQEMYSVLLHDHAFLVVLWLWHSFCFLWPLKLRYGTQMGGGGGCEGTN